MAKVYWPGECTDCENVFIRLLWVFDIESAKSFILDCGVVDMSVDKSKSTRATDALEKALANDDSKWVWIQALRSLCAPGRDMDNTRIPLSLEQEQDNYVLRVWKKFIGF